MYSRFYNLLPTKKNIADQSIYLLNYEEINYIKKCEKLSIILSAFIGGIMVVALYLPQYMLPGLFPESLIEIPYIEQKIPFNLTFTIYGITLVFFELFLLMLLNIYCCHEIGLSTGFIDSESKYKKENKDFLLKISKQNKTKEIHELGIDPYLGLSKTSIFLMNLFFTLKATLTNYFVRFIIQKLLGRYALRLVLDMSGIPIFAFWNAWGTRTVLRESRIIIMGVNYVKHFKTELEQFRTLTDKEKTLLYDTLQFIAMSKRDYHQNHYSLAKTVIDAFQIKTESRHLISDDYYSLLKSGNEDFRQLNEKIILLGFVMDGNISAREKRRIDDLYSQKIITKNYDAIKILSKNFLYGKGL